MYIVICIGLKRKETGTEHAAIATSNFGLFLEVYRACKDSIHMIGSNIFYTPGLYCSSAKPLTVFERTLKQVLSSNYKTTKSSF